MKIRLLCSPQYNTILSDLGEVVGGRFSGSTIVNVAGVVRRSGRECAASIGGSLKSQRTTLDKKFVQLHRELSGNADQN